MTQVPSSHFRQYRDMRKGEGRLGIQVCALAAFSLVPSNLLAGTGRPVLFLATKGSSQIAMMGTIHSGVVLADMPACVSELIAGNRRAFFEAAEPDAEASYEQDRQPLIGGGLPLSAMSELGMLRSQGDPAFLHQLSQSEQQVMLDVLNHLRSRQIIAPGKLSSKELLSKLSIDGANDLFELAVFQRYLGMLDVELEIVAQRRGIPTESLDDLGSLNDPALDHLWRQPPLTQLHKKLAKPFQVSFDQFQRLRDAFLSGDVPRMSREFAEASADTNPAETAAELEKRNRRWVQKLDAAAASDQRVFAAAGVEHLITGDQTLADLLRAQGYSVVSLDAACRPSQR